MSTIICPPCHKDDTIRKVSAIVTSQPGTELATILTAPSDPKVSLGFRSLGVRLLFTPICVLLASWADNLIRSNLSLNIIFGIILYLISFGYIIWIFVWYISTPRKKDEADYKEEKSKWNLPMKRWNRLYYCHRKGIVFDPETEKTCEPAKIKEFLYQKSQIQNLKL